MLRKALWLAIRGSSGVYSGHVWLSGRKFRSRSPKMRVSWSPLGASWAPLGGVLGPVVLWFLLLVKYFGSILMLVNRFSENQKTLKIKISRKSLEMGVEKMGMSDAKRLFSKNCKTKVSF